MTQESTRRTRIGNGIVVSLLVATALWWLSREPDLHRPAVGALRWLVAGAVAFAYVALCLAALMKSRRARRSASVDDGTVLVVFATQTGFAEELATRTADAIRSAGHRVALLPAAQLDAATLASTRLAFFVVATYGDGEPPDTTRRFVRVLDHGAALGALRFGLLALGDRSYAEYCGFGRTLERWLHANGAQSLFPVVEVDQGAAEPIATWFERLRPWTGTAMGNEEAAPVFERWTLASRRIANDGSVGAPVWHLAFEPVAAERPTWRAGDIAVVRLPGGERREYSIASLPSDGRVELLVRQTLRPDGRVGAGAAWLATTMRIGEATDLRIRVNHGFRLESFDVARPLILIGNGTGIAGLRAHLKARVAAGARRNWLVFGERNAAFDDHYGPEVRAWQAAGFVERLSLAFSRDGAARVHVQQRLLEEREAVARWIADGAVLLVCGSADGMAGGVDAVLQEIVGGDAVDDLMASGRYRRDVY